MSNPKIVLKVSVTVTTSIFLFKLNLDVMTVINVASILVSSGNRFYILLCGVEVTLYMYYNFMTLYENVIWSYYYCTLCKTFHNVTFIGRV